MLDTVHLYLRGISIPPGFDDNKWQLSDTCKRGWWKQKLFARDELLLKTGGIRQLKLYDGVVSLKISSLPKILIGHNILNLSEHEVELAVDLVDTVVRSFFRDCWGNDLVPSLPSVRNWNVSRVDVGCNIRPRLADPATCIRAIRTLDASHGLKASWMGDETVYFRSGAKRRRVELIFYNKHLECRARKEPVVAEQAEGMLRFEVRLFGGRKIAEYLKLDRSPILNDLLAASTWASVLTDHLGRLAVKPGHQSIDGSWESLRSRVSPRRADDLYGVMRLVQEHGWPELRRRRGKDWVGRRKKWLREAGLMNVAIDTPGLLDEVLNLVRSSALAAERPQPRTAKTDFPGRQRIIAPDTGKCTTGEMDEHSRAASSSR